MESHGIQVTPTRISVTDWTYKVDIDNTIFFQPIFTHQETENVLMAGVAVMPVQGWLKSDSDNDESSQSSYLIGSILPAFPTLSVSATILIR